MMGRYAVQVEDRVFGGSEDEPLLLRLYRPQGKGPFPALIDVHGGAWTTQTRTQNERIDTWLAAHGCVVAALDFRMPPQYAYPASVADVNLGTRWLKAHADSLDIDPQRIGGLGTSSGGHQLLLSALRPRHARYMTEALLPDATMAASPSPEALDGALAFVITGWPVADPLARYRMVTERNNKNLLDAHHAFWPSEAEMEDGNPTLLLTRGETGASGLKLPPLLVLQGTNDDNLTPDMADRLVAAWQAAEGSATLIKYEGRQHAFVLREFDSDDAQHALMAMRDFIPGLVTTPA